MSQDGVVLGIDAKFLNDLKKADESLRRIEVTTRNMTQSFIHLSERGIRTVGSSFNYMVQEFQRFVNTNVSKSSGIGQVSNMITDASNKLTTMETLVDRVVVGGKGYSYGGRFHAINEELQLAISKLGELQTRLANFRSTGADRSTTGQGYAASVDYLTREVNATMQKIQLLEQEQKQIVNNAQARIQSSMSQQELDRQWMAMERDKAKREQEAAEAASRNAKQRSEAYARSYEEQYRMYEKMFDKISRKEQEASRKTFSGAMKYSAEAQTIQQQIQAIKYLKQARTSLDKSQLGQKAYEQQVRAINKEIQRQQSEVDRLTNKYRGASNSAQGFGNILRTVFGIEAMRRFASQLVQIRGEFELQQRSLQALLQNRQEADELWDRTVQLAIRSPFQIKQLVTYTKQLAAYRVESDKLYDTTKMLADISAGLGVDMQRLILAYGQVKAANYLRGTELRQFSEAGINVLGELATYFSELEGRAVTVGQVFERVSKRMVAFADVDEVLRRVTGEGGIFYNMQEKQAETLKGQISNLKDSLHIMFNDIGQSNEGMLKSMVSMIRYVLENWQMFMAVLKGAAVVMASLGVATLATSWKMGAFSASTIAATASTTGLTAAVARLGISLKSMFSVMAAHPIALVVGLIAAAGVAIYDMTRASKRAREEYEKSVGEIVANRIEVSAYSEKLIQLTKAQNELNESMKDSSKTSDEYAKKQEELSNIEKEREKTIKALSAIDSSYAQMMMSKKNDVEQLAIAARAYNDELRARLELENKLVDTPEDVSEWQDLYTSEQRALSKLLGTRGEYTKRVEDLLSGDTSNLYATEKNALNEFLTSADTYENRIIKLYKDLKMFRDGDTRGIGAFATLGFDWNTPMNTYLRAQLELDKQEKIIKDQLETSAEDFRNTERGKSLIDILSSDSASQEQKDNAKNAIINFFDGILTDKKVEGELRRRVQNTLAESFNIDWRIIEGTNLEQWQKNYNALLEGLTEGTQIGGLTAIRSNQTSRADQLKQIEDFITSQKTIIDAYGVEGQGAYTKEDKLLAEYAKSVAEKLRTFLGGTDKKDTNRKTDEWTNMIRVIKEVHNAYNDLSKTFEKTTARAGTMVKYTDALTEALARVKVNGQTLSAEAFMNMFDLTTEEGMKNALKWIEKDAPEAADRLKAKLERGDITWEANIEVKKGDDEKLNQSVEDLFSGYELSVELEKLNIPREFAQGLFDIKAFSLDEVRTKLESMQHLFTGKGQVEKFGEFQRKLAEMETKEQRERLKTYLEYARDAVGERAKIKLDEMKKLNEIELAFAVKEGDSAGERDFKNTARAKAIEKVGEDSVKAMRKLEWEEFQKSDSFVSLFADLDIASEKLLNHTISKLQDFREEWKDMPLEDVRTIVSKMGELESQLAKSDPFNMGKALRKELRGAPSIHELQEDNWTQEEKIRAIDKELEISEQVLQLRLEGKAVEADTLVYDSKREELLYLSAEETKKIVDNQKDAKQTAQDQVTTNNQLLGKYKASKEALLAQSEAIQSAQKMANDLYDAFKELSEVLGEDDSPAAMFAEMGMSMANSVLNCLALQAQLASATEGAMAFGTAMNMAMGIIGWIVMAVQLIATVLKTAFAMHDNNLEKQIERLQERVEILQKQFEKLSDAIDNAFSNKQLAAYSEDARKNMEAQLHAYEQMIAMEEAKKKTDHDKIKGWREDMEELREDFEDMLEEAFSTATSGIVDDVLSATREFVDAWHDAFLETGDGMKGLKDNFREMLTEILRQQASLQLISPFVNMYKDWLKEYVDIESGDATLSIGEAREWAEKVQATFPEINNLLQNFFSGAEDLLREEGELSELSKGIQGVTETTAQVLEALLNSMRFYVADTNMRVQNIESVLASSDVTRNPILNELQQQTAMVRSIESMFNSVIGRGSSAHSGAYLKVLM